MRSSVDLPEPEVPTITVIELLLDLHRHVIDHGRRAVLLAEVLDRDHCLHPLHDLHQRIEHHRRGECQRDDRNRPEQHQVDRRLADALEHEGTQAAAADERRHRHHADVLHQHHADAGEDHRQRERQLDRRVSTCQRRSCPCRAPPPPRRARRASAPRRCWPRSAAASTETAPPRPAPRRCRGCRALRPAAPAAASAPSGAMRMPNSAIAGMVWMTFSVPRIRRASAARGSRGCRAAAPPATAAPSEPSARQHVPAQLVREALGVDRVLAHDRQVVEAAVRERQAPRRPRKPARNSTRVQGPGAQARDGIGRHEPQAQQQHPERRPRGRCAPPCCPPA